MIVEDNEFCNGNNVGIIFESSCINNPTIKHNSINNFYDIGRIASISFYTKVNGTITKIPRQDYEPNYSYLNEQNITDFYNKQAVNMDNSTLYISKGVATSFPAKDLQILGKEMKLQTSN